MTYCIYCDENPCACTAEQKFAGKHPDVTDQERDEIRKNALWERHQATEDFALHQQKVENLTERLREIVRQLEHDPARDRGTSLEQMEIPTADEIRRSAKEREAAGERKDSAGAQCMRLGLE